MTNARTMIAKPMAIGPKSLTEKLFASSHHTRPTAKAKPIAADIATAALCWPKRLPRTA